MAEITFVPQSPYQAFLQSPIAANARLTLVSGQPVMSSSVLAATQVFVTPYLGSRIPFYNPAATEWRSELFTEMAINLALGTGAQQVTTASNYDVYAWLSSTSGGRPVAALSPAWASDTSIGTNPGSAERIGVGGIILNRWDINGGPPSMRGTYLGSIRTGSSAAVDWQFGGLASGWTPAIHAVYNYFNRKTVSGKLGETGNGGAWTWTSSIYRVANGNSTTARVSAIMGVNEDPVRLYYACRAAMGAAGNIAIGISLDTTSTNVAIQGDSPSAANVTGLLTAEFADFAGAGFHFWNALEAVTQGTTGTYVGGTTAPLAIQHGMTYQLLM